MAEILIVDDDHHLRQGFQRLLDAEGYETRTAASAEEALNLMREKMPQCVVMDVRMPGMDGLEALKRMRALEGCPPVVIMTAYSTTETAIEATRLGAFDYMLKPFDIPQVLELLRQLEQVGNLRSDALELLLKAAGIGLTAEVAGLVCADAGNAALAKMLRLLGTAAILCLSVPMFTALLECITEMVGYG